MEEDKIVLIKVKLKTRERLKAIGSKGQTYDNVITHLLIDSEGLEEGEIR